MPGRTISAGDAAGKTLTLDSAGNILLDAGQSSATKPKRYKKRLRCAWLIYNSQCPSCGSVSRLREEKSNMANGVQVEVVKTKNMSKLIEFERRKNNDK
jgi:uncharacterized protein YbbK (DUF523 family)